MANWQYEIKIKTDKEDVTAIDFAKIAVKEINRILPGVRRRYEDMADDLENNILPLFEEIIEANEDDDEMFDNALEYLYDWGDTALDNLFGGKRMCWIETRF